MCVAASDFIACASLNAIVISIFHTHTRARARACTRVTFMCRESEPSEG